MQLSRIFAVTRTQPSGALQSLINQSDNRVVSIIIDDITDETKVSTAMLEAETSLQGRGLDVLINNAGVQPFSPKLSEMPSKELVDVLRTNLVSVHVMTAAALRLLRLGAQKKVINISTAMGSIAYTERFKVVPTHAYEISKAGLNMLTAQYAMEYAQDGFTLLAISPGWLNSDMGTGQADLEVAVGVKSLKEKILQTTEAMNGKFLNIHVPGWEEADGPNQYDGRGIPW